MNAARLSVTQIRTCFTRLCLIRTCFRRIRQGLSGIYAPRGGPWSRVLILCLAVAVPYAVLPSPALAQPDSVRTEILIERGLPPDHTPRKALFRAMALPGWGQWYNDQYYKIPIVYAGLAGLTYSVLRNHDQYKLYQRAHLFRISEERLENEGDPNPYAQFEPQYRIVQSDLGSPGTEINSRVLRSRRDRFRRWRDLSVVGSGVFYALSIVDAYVSAHLLTFDVGDELSVNVVPSPLGNSMAVRVRF